MTRHYPASQSSIDIVNGFRERCAGCSAFWPCAGSQLEDLKVKVDKAIHHLKELKAQAVDDAEHYPIDSTLEILQS